MATLLALLRDARFAEALLCPRCRHRRIQRWGRFGARQRYRCLGCRRTFSDLTGTPAVYCKLLPLWAAFGRCMSEGLTSTQAAAQLGIHPQTAWRWRHRLLDDVRRRAPDRLRGMVELEETVFARSEKGSRRLRRRPRRHACRYPRLTELAVFVVAARDRCGASSSWVGGNHRPRAWQIRRWLEPRVDAGATLVTRFGPVSAYGRVAVDCGYRLARTTPPEGRVPRAHVQNVVAQTLRLRGWLSRFRGVATRYLPNYLTWHRQTDSLAQELDGAGWWCFPLHPRPCSSPSSLP